MNIVPRPVEFSETQGAFGIGSKTVVRAPASDREAIGIAQYLAGAIAGMDGVRPAVRQQGTSHPGRGEILLSTDAADTACGPEGYELTVTTESVILRAAAAAGLFYGVQSLLQLLPPSATGDAARPAAGPAIPCCRISDRPRFPWRGMMLDVSRHFFPIAFIKRCIDLLALHKMNVFHWHLTDDGGWRMEVKSRAKLTGVGAWRAGDGVGWVWPIRFPGDKATEQVYGGFYTQAEIREIVEYGRSRFVRIVPEIEMPGHSLAALDAYPELRCRGKGVERQNVFCAGNEDTFRLLEDVLAEAMALFPDVPIHIGGDEVHKGHWEQCELCQARMRAEGLRDMNELQSYFIKRIEKFVNSHGRSIIGWDEILEGGLAPNAAVMSWRGVEGGIAAANAGHDVVMSPTSHCYFDYCQSGDPSTEPRSIGGNLPLETVYAFEPVPASLPAEKRRHILGTQGNVWTEFIETPGHAEYMMFPRLAALAEVAWSPAERRDWTDFGRRMETHLRRLAGLRVNYRKTSPGVAQG